MSKKETAAGTRVDPVCLLSDSDSDGAESAPARSHNRKRPPSPPSESGSGEGSGSRRLFSPFRLYTTSNDVSSSTRSADRPPFTSTLREMIGIDTPTASPFEADSLASTDGGNGRGALRWICIINYLIDFDFLLDEIPELLSLNQIVVLYGSPMNQGGPTVWRNAAQPNTVDFIRLVPSDPPNSAYNPLSFKMPYGVHHTKMFLVGYGNAIRVVIHTSNLRRSDFRDNAQGAYVQEFPLKEVFRSPPTAAAANDGGGGSFSVGSKGSNMTQGERTRQHCSSDDVYATSSQFEEDLISYLESYQQKTKYSWPLEDDDQHQRGVASASACRQVSFSLTEVLRRYDYSSAYVVLVPSVPGKQYRLRNCPYGHLKLRDAIRRNTTIRPRGHSNGEDDCGSDADGKDGNDQSGPIIFQFSSLGSTSEKWLHEVLSSVDVHAARSSRLSELAKGATTSPLLDKLKIVWPTMEEIRTSQAGYASGGPIPGRIKSVDKPFLARFYHRWCSANDPMRKGQFPGHIKTFLQLSADESEVEWCFLTSHNLSMAALGQIQNSSSLGEKALFIRHWELGVFISPETLANCNILGRGKDAAYAAAAVDQSSKRPRGSDQFERLKMVPFTGIHSNYGPGDVVLPLPFDIAPTRYGTNDIPWATDRSCPLPDAYGRMLL